MASRVSASVRRVARALEQRLSILVATLTAVVLLVLFYYPVATIFVDAVLADGRLTVEPITAVLTSEFYLVDIIWFTAKQAFYSTLASLALGLLAAWLFAHFEFRGRETLRSLIILPFVMPSTMVAIGFVVTFGRSGTLNRALSLVGLPPVGLLLTPEATVVAHTFYNTPFVARVVTAAWESIGARTIETARSLGANPRRAFRDVVLPQLLSSIGVGTTLTFIFTFASFLIVLALGGFQLATIEVFVYSWVRDLTYAEAASLTVVEMAVSITLIAVYLRYEASQRSAGGAANPLPRQSILPADWTPKSTFRTVGIGGYALVVGLMFVVPVASMVLASVASGGGGLALVNYVSLAEQRATGASFQVKPLPAILNSLGFATGTLVVTVPMGVTIAVLTTRRYRGCGFIDVLSMTPFVVSGIVVGLGLLRGLMFSVDVLGTRIRVIGALAIVAAHAVGAYPFVTRNVAPLFARLDGRLMESVRPLGATRTRALVDIELPLVWTGVVAGAASAVAISAGEFDSTIILAEGVRSYTMPVTAERFFGRRLGPATVMGCLLLLITSAGFLVVDRLGGRWGELWGR